MEGTSEAGVRQVIGTTGGGGPVWVGWVLYDTAVHIRLALIPN